MGLIRLTRSARFIIYFCWLATHAVVAAEVDLKEPAVKYLHQIWQAEEGLPSPVVRTILQTRDGYLWIATQDGVVRFDGVRFTAPIDAKQGLEFDKSRQYFALAETKDGSVWTSTTKGLARMKEGKVTYFTAKDGLPESGYVLTVYEDKQGTLWAGCTDGLARFENGKFKLVLTLREDKSANVRLACTNGFSIFTNSQFSRATETDGYFEPAIGGSYDETSAPNVHSMRVIYEDRMGNLWVGASKGVIQIKGDNVMGYFLRENAPDRLPNNAIQCIYETRDGSLWIGTSRGLARWKDGQSTLYGEDTQNGLEHETVRSIYEDSSGVLWVGTFRGVQQFVDGKFLRVAITGPMASDFGNIVPGFIYAICGDREGNIWLGSTTGLNRLRKQTFETFSKSEGLLSIITTSVIESRSGDMWVGTYGGGLSQFHDGTITNWTEKLFTRILALCEDRHNNLWIGTENYGLYRLTDGKLTNYSSNQIADTVIKVIYEDSKGTLWIGGPLGLTRYKDGKFDFYSREARYASGAPLVLTTVKVILEDRHGSLWIGSKEGLTRLQENKPAKNYENEAGAPQEMVNALYEDADGVIWIGTETGKLFSLKNERKDRKFESYTKEDTAETPNLFGRILHILEDDNANLWMSTRNGIFRLSKKELNDFATGASTNISSVSYGKLDGMRRAQCNGIAQPAGWRARDGRLWFPTLAGVVAVDVKNIEPNRVKPPVVIEKVLVDGKEIERGGRAVIPPGKSQVEFQYTALSFQLPEKVRFKYLLEGNDAQWQDVGSKRSVTFLNLAPGKYTFRVRACNNEGVWNEAGDSFAFSLSPRFYETYPFYWLCVAVVALIIWILYRLRWQALQRRQEELERLVTERTQNLQLEITERKAAESALVESQQMVLRQERLSAVGQLSAGIAHEFNNILTVIQGHTAFLLGKPNLDEDSTKSLRHISTGVERTAKLTQQMLTFSRRQIMQQQVLDLNDAINHVTAMLGRLLGENIKLRRDLDPQLPTVRADPGMIDQIVTNLAVNARDAMPKGGELIITTKTVNLTAVSASSHSDAYPGKFVCLSVSDTGSGMDDATINRIFEPFFTTKGVGKGTGLGLATVYGIVKQHQGWIEVSSKIGQGTTFKIYFPISGKPSEAAAEKFSLPRVRGGKETILVVEDQADLRELIRDILESHGYRILEAGDGVEALAVWEREGRKIDLLLTDMVMPEGMSGRDLAEKLQATHPLLPVIYSSGYSKEMMDNAPEQRQGVAFLSKPYHPAQLAQTVRECLDASNNPVEV